MASSKADDLYSKAEKKLKGFSVFGNKHEDAKDLFLQAANAYKACSNWDGAGKSFIQAYECAMKCKDPIEAASMLTDASSMFKKVDLKKAAEYLSQAITLFEQNGRSSKNAKLSLELGELFEKAGDLDHAREWFLKASDYYRQENSAVSASQCKIRIADLLCGPSSDLRRFDQAIQLYEEVAEASASDPLLKTTSKGYFFMALLVAVGKGSTPEQLERKLEEYSEKDIFFDANTREYTFVSQTIAALRESDPNAFQEAYTKFNSILAFSKLQASLLKRVQETLENPNMT